MAIYVFIVLFEIFAFGNYRIGGYKRAHILPYIGFLALFLVLGLRFDIGADYSQYYTNFQKAIQRGDELDYEPLNNILFELFRYAESPQLIIASYGLITLSLVFRTIRMYTANLYTGMLVYTALFYLGIFSTMRQGLAAAIILSSYPFLRDGKYCKYLFLCIIASLFHYSAVIAVFFPFFFNCKIKYMLWIMGGTLLVSFTGIEAIIHIPILNKYSFYLELLQKELGGGNVQKIFFWSIVAGLWIIGGYKQKENRKLLVLCTFGCIFPILLGGHIGGRLSQYMYIFLSLSISNILHESRIFVKTIYVLLLNAWFLLYAYVGTDGDGVKTYIPYQTILEVNTTEPIFKE